MHDTQRETDTGWIGVDADDDLDQRLAGESDAFDPTRPHVMTALGPILPAALGVTFVHETVVNRSAETASDLEPGAAIDHATLAELEVLFAVGGRTVVDTGSAANARLLSRLRWIAGRAPTHLIAVARLDAVDRDWRQSGGERLVHQLTVGSGEPPLRPGLILVDAERPAAAAVMTEIVHATAQAHRTTGVPIMLRCGETSIALRLLDTLVGDGVSATRVLVGGFTTATSLDEELKLLATGAYRAFDRVARDAPDAARQDAAAIHTLIERGFGEQLLLSPGLRPRGDPLARRTGADWGWLLERFTIDLMEAGIDASRVRRLLVDNPAQLLAIQPEQQ